MLRLLFPLIMLFALMAGQPGSVQAQVEHDASEHSRGAVSSTTPVVKLLDNLGDHSYAVSTLNSEAQAFFNQGLRLYYGFNHAEAIKSFKEAQRLDPECAMCYWGEALSWGPNINMPMDSAGHAAALEAIDKAQARLESTTANEKALINALASRYSSDENVMRAELDSAYAAEMRKAKERFPQDDEIAVLFAEAVMTTMPWDYWNEQAEPRTGIPEALEALKRVMKRNPDNPGACHFYIHAVEKHYPEKAVHCAEHLASLMPGAGHLVHMPGHIYIRVGRYEDAIEANKHAVHADETYIQDVRPGVSVYTAGYYPHNYDFMAFAASMIGDCDLAVSAAEQVRDVIPSEMVGDPSLMFLQLYVTRPLQMLVRCERWDEILGYEVPDPGLRLSRAIWHYARGRALAATGDLDAARGELSRLNEIRTSPEMEEVRLEFNSAGDLLMIAESVLAGWIAAAEGNYDEAVDQLKTAVKFEDGLLYGEPPEWSVPVRHDLGAVLLLAGRADDAVKIYQQDLDRFPKNVVSVEGLEKANAGSSSRDSAG